MKGNKSRFGIRSRLMGICFSTDNDKIPQERQRLSSKGNQGSTFKVHIFLVFVYVIFVVFCVYCLLISLCIDLFFLGIVEEMGFIWFFVGLVVMPVVF
jgi:hypothetical protein